MSRWAAGEEPRQLTGYSRRSAPVDVQPDASGSIQRRGDGAILRTGSPQTHCVTPSERSSGGEIGAARQQEPSV